MKRARGRAARAPELSSFIAPCLATAASHPPTGAQWVHEIKYDGYRVQAHIASGEARLLTRSGLDWSDRLGLVRAELAALDARSAIIDGEMIVEDTRGASDFHALQREIKLAAAARIDFVAFDLLELNGCDTRKLLLPERKTELQKLLGVRPAGALLRFSEHIESDGSEVLRHACALGLEGVVSKRIDRPYRSGRSEDWIKVKCVLVERFVVGGYVPQKGADESIGSLVLGYFVDGALRYAGRVGTGFSADEAYAIWHALQAVRRKQPPFDAPLEREQRQGVVWVEPRLVVEIAHRDWTHDNVLRHSAFRRLCLDAVSVEVGTPASLRHSG